MRISSASVLEVGYSTERVQGSLLLFHSNHRKLAILKVFQEFFTHNPLKLADFLLQPIYLLEVKFDCIEYGPLQNCHKLPKIQQTNQCQSIELEDQLFCFVQ